MLPPAASTEAFGGGKWFLQKMGSSFCLIVCGGKIGPERCGSTEPEWRGALTPTWHLCSRSACPFPSRVTEDTRSRKKRKTYLLIDYLYVCDIHILVFSTILIFLRGPGTQGLQGVEKANCPRIYKGLLCCYFKEHCVSFARHLQGWLEESGFSLTAEAVSEFLPLLSALYWPFWGHRGSIRDATLMFLVNKGAGSWRPKGRGPFPPALHSRRIPGAFYLSWS